MRPTDEYLATLTENTRRYILDLEAELARLRLEIERLRTVVVQVREELRSESHPTFSDYWNEQDWRNWHEAFSSETRMLVRGQ